ncbi:MAG TPA: ADP-ribosylglycohydrolase family protein [Aggregatilineaceae bacterium]|nr:ADP-ribosylglycohydrolase family protein [Aggregatilineaceae bacterium]
MLLELAIGDAYGAGFEYANRQLIRQFNDLRHYSKHPRHSIHPGHYTDDTQMTLAIVEAMLSGEEWTPLYLAERFVTVFKRDPREGYASRFHAFLRHVENGEQFLAEIIPTSDKSGAAMRAVPIGLYPTIEQVIQRTTQQAIITHNTPDGINAAIAAALMSHYFVYQLGPQASVGEFIESHVEGQWADPWTGQVGSKGWMSVKAAITAVQQHTSLSEMLRACIAYSGDVDTVATIALGAASASVEVKHDLPQPLINGLENGPYGRDYLIDLDRQLLAWKHK